MKTTSWMAGVVLGVSLVTGCTDEGSDKPDESDVKGGADGKAEAWGSADNPALFNGSLEYRVAELPQNGEARNIPWAGSYWPVYEDSINYKWAGATSKSPAAKYGEAFGVTEVENAVSRYHGIDAQASRTACTSDSQCNAELNESCAKREGATDGRCIPTWWGICHAWAPAAILLPEPKKPVTHNGVEFKVQDIKALVTLAHDRTETKFVSLRCDAYDSQDEITFDKYGRPTGGDANCKDTNPGTFHVLMTNYLGKQGESFVYDRTWDGEVWNQPLRGYRITAMTEVSEQMANELVGVPPENGSVPTDYVFNANAAKLYKVHMDVDYISESSASTDGNLGSTIDSYTHQDRYDYILEVDAAGKIIGGEWIGTSKQKHPDFVWLPIRHGSTSVAGGKITYANVKMIYDLSMQDGNGGGGGMVRDVTETGTVARSAWKQYGPFNVAAGTTFTATLTGDNDADLYVRKGAAPTSASYDCRPYRNGSSESCSIVGPATIYVGVNGYATSSTFAVNIKYTEGSGMTPVEPTPVFAHLSQTGSVAQGAMKVFELPMPAGKRVVIRTTSTKDVDLYIQFGAAPTTAQYLSRGYTTSGNETISYTATSNGVLYIGVHGYQAGSFSVRTAD